MTRSSPAVDARSCEASGLESGESKRNAAYLLRSQTAERRAPRDSTRTNRTRFSVAVAIRVVIHRKVSVAGFDGEKNSPRSEYAASSLSGEISSAAPRNSVIIQEHHVRFARSATHSQLLVTYARDTSAILCDLRPRRIRNSLCYARDASATLCATPARHPQLFVLRLRRIRNSSCYACDASKRVFALSIANATNVDENNAINFDESAKRDDRAMRSTRRVSSRFPNERSGPRLLPSARAL